MRVTVRRALLVYPEFRSASFWNYRDTCRLMDARYPAAPLGLCTVAALLPPDWEVRLVDRNVEPWDDAMLEWADIVMTGGMLSQQLDSLEIIRKARARGRCVVAGGPDPTLSPHLYTEASHLVLGEGEVTLPMFLADLQAGTPDKIYRSDRPADMQTSPVPRFDLLRFDRYLHIGVQWCRGCPFNCEFCDIITLFGRVPRAKTPAQMLRELQRLHDLGYRGHVDLVDDNFIGNKKLAKQFLPALRDWLEERDFPFEFTTEASINLADDAELLRLMQAAGFYAVFIGIESPEHATLLAMQKRQNTKRPIADSVQRIYRHGMFVNAGFILGFDSEQGSVAAGITECIEQAAIPVNMVGLLFALPGTQLTERLRKAGRLAEGWDQAPEGEGDQCGSGLNFETCRPRADILRDYLHVVETAYAPRAYLARVRRVGRLLDSSQRRYRPTVRYRLKALRALWRLAWHFSLRRDTVFAFWYTFAACLIRNPRSLPYALSLIALYLHFGPFATYIAGKITGELARLEPPTHRFAPLGGEAEAAASPACQHG
jgi:radical SAM superfamily enzyme YgiQ (UPF0313 family)